MTDYFIKPLRAVHAILSSRPEQVSASRLSAAAATAKSNLRAAAHKWSGQDVLSPMRGWLGSSSKTQTLAGVDLGASNVRSMVQIGDRHAIDTSRLESSDPDAVADAVVSSMGRAASSLGVTLDDIDRVGIGVPAVLDAQRRMILSAPNLGWTNVAFGEVLSKRLATRQIEFFEDVEAAAASQLQRAKQLPEGWGLAYVSGGTGVGVTFIARDGQMFVTELGHIRPFNGLDGRPRLCGCGSMGCAESVLGGKAIGEMTDELLDSGAYTRSPLHEVRRIRRAEGQPIQASDVDAAFRAGDPLAIYLWTKVCAPALGTLLSNLPSIQAKPLEIVLSGGVLKTSPALLSLAKSHFQPMEPFKSSVLDTLDAPAPGATGAAVLLRERGQTT